MKIKILPTERRIVRQFKPRKVSVAQVEEEFERLIELSKNRYKGRAISAILNFDDESGKGALTTNPIDFQEGDRLNLIYLATQMLNERYASANQELKDDFMNLLYDELADEENETEEIQPVPMVVTTQILSQPVKAVLKECISCGEEIAESMVYCPYCGQNQRQPAVEDFPDEVIEENLPVIEQVQPEVEPIEAPTEILPNLLLEDLETLIHRRNEETLALIKTQISEKITDQKNQARKQKEEVLEHQKQEKLDAARQAYEAAKKEIETQARIELQTALSDIETRAQKQLESELPARLQKQEENVQQLLVQLSQFLHPTESSPFV